VLDGRFTVLGGGHGISSVARALRGTAAEVTLIVSTADDGGSSGQLRRRWGGPAVGDMRRSLAALSGDDSLVAQTLSHPVTLGRAGTHPLGNLMLRSLADAFGDLAVAARWLEDELGIAAQVLPATLEPVSLVAVTEDDRRIYGESAIGRCSAPIHTLRFEPASPASPAAAVAAIGAADYVLIAPGSLFTSTLAATALPQIAAALNLTSARVVWLCNLERGNGETARMSGAEHLAALRRHGVRPDVAVHDPEAEVHPSGPDLSSQDIQSFPSPLQSSTQPGVHDAELLRGALEHLTTGCATPVCARAGLGAGG
jgi:uncharacterized cofD-like protein